MSFSSDGQRILTNYHASEAPMAGEFLRRLTLWDAKTGKELWWSVLKGTSCPAHSKYRNQVNIDTDGRLVWTRVHREFFRDKPGEFDFRPPGKIFMQAYADFIAHKNEKLGSAGQLEAIRDICPHAGAIDAILSSARNTMTPKLMDCARRLLEFGS